MAADRFSINKNFDAIQAKYVGTGHADMTKFEWGTNQHRDTCASLIGHHDMLSFIAVAQNDSVGRARYQLLEVLVQSFIFNLVSMPYLSLLIFLAIDSNVL